MNEAEVVLGVVLVPGEDASEILQPCVEPLHLPAAAVAAKNPAILRGGLFPSPAMRRDHLDALLCESRIQRIAVVRFVADQPFRSLSHETRFQSCLGCWLLPVAVVLDWAGLLFVHDRYEVPLSIAAAEARHDDDFDPVNGGAALLLAGWLVPFLPCLLTLMLVYLFRACGSRLPPSVPPNHALQRTEAGDEAASDHHA